MCLRQAKGLREMYSCTPSKRIPILFRQSRKEFNKINGLKILKLFILMLKNIKCPKLQIFSFLSCWEQSETINYLPNAYYGQKRTLPLILYAFQQIMFHIYDLYHMGRFIKIFLLTIGTSIILLT